MKAIRPAIALGIAALFLGSADRVSAAAPPALTGSIGGTVRNSSGVVQMGATVILYNRYDRVLGRVMTNADGSFAFDALIPDLYSLRVSLANFIPAFKNSIAVKPGFHSVLTINMASMFSSIEFVTATPNRGSLMSDEWKWVLRSSQATRPILRFRDLGISDRKPARTASVFSETRGVVRLSAGDASSFASSGAQPDLGTAFALATSVFGTNQLEVSGNFGISAHTGLPTAGFRTSYKGSREGRPAPEITVGMHQIYLPTRGGFGPRATQDGAPALRSVSIATLDEINVTDNVRLEYGMSAESVSLIDRLNTLSPFGRLTYDLGSHGAVRLAYSSGSAATELAAGLGKGGRDELNLSDNVAALASVPRLSMRDGRVHAMRTGNLELGYTKVAKSRTFSGGVYRETVRNGALMMAGSGDLFDRDTIPDLASRSSIFDIGGFQRWGYVASVSQNVGDRLELSVAYGRGGALAASDRDLQTSEADELRRMVHVKQRNWATAHIKATAPLTGTRIVASYGWADYRSLMPAHLFLTQRLSQDPGVNIAIRQPLPSFGGVPGRFEATAELRNLLEQGYLPFTTADGRTLVLTNAPRAVRGGLSFIF